MIYTMTAKRLADRIKKAIEDHKITSSEYEEILNLAYADGVVDPMEQRMLSELNHMIDNRTVKRVAG